MEKQNTKKMEQNLNGTEAVSAVNAPCYSNGIELCHDDLLEPASEVLKMTGKLWKCHSTFTELRTAAGEIPDVMGFASGKTAIAEVKVSRSDFFADANKPFRIEPKKGLGNFRFYVCPIQMIWPKEVPNNWGLVWVDELDASKFKIVKMPDWIDSDREKELWFACSVMRRTNAHELL